MNQRKLIWITMPISVIRTTTSIGTAGSRTNSETLTVRQIIGPVSYRSPAFVRFALRRRFNSIMPSSKKYASSWTELSAGLPLRSKRPSETARSLMNSRNQFPGFICQSVWFRNVAISSSEASGGKDRDIAFGADATTLAHSPSVRSRC